jgi:hypothetical protein
MDFESMLSTPPHWQAVSNDLPTVLQEPLLSPLLLLSLPPSPLLLPYLCRLASVIPLPPEAVYSSSNKLYTAIQAHAKQYNYTFIQGKSRVVNQHGRRKIVYSCNCCSQPLPELQLKTGKVRKRKTTT